MVYLEPEAYSEPQYSQAWNIQKTRIFRTVAYSEPCQTSTMKRFAKIVNGYNYFRKL